MANRNDANININTANGASGPALTEAEMKRDAENASQVLGKQKKKTISIPKQMAPFTGETMIACINGACIRVPVDGESYDIPEAYYDIIQNSLKTIQASDVRAERGFGDKVNDPELTK